MTEDERRRFVVPPATGELDGVDLAFLDPSDEDDRRILILAEHPELHAAIANDRDKIHLYGTTISPALRRMLRPRSCGGASTTSGWWSRRLGLWRRAR